MQLTLEESSDKLSGHVTLFLINRLTIIYIDSNDFFKHFNSLSVREPNSENCLDLMFAALPCEKVIIVPDTNYITSAIIEFMLDMPSAGSLQNIDRFNMYKTGLRSCETIWFKLGKN